MLLLLPFILLCLISSLGVVIGQSVSNSSDSLIFGRSLAPDPYNNITSYKDGTVVVTPRMNTTGLIEIKIGVLMPFSQTVDSNTETITWSGWSAIRMAVNQINQQRTIPGAYISLYQKDSFPGKVVDQTAVTDAVYASVTLLKKSVVGVIGDVSSSWTSLSAIMTSTLDIPQCSFTASQPAFSDKSQYKSFFRTIPTGVIIADAMLSFTVSQGWTRVGILAVDDALGQQFYQRAIVQSGLQNVHITSYQSFASDADNSDIQSSLVNITNSARIIMVVAMGDTMGSVLIQAAQLGLMSNDYVWMLMDDLTAVLPSMNVTMDINSTFEGTFMFDNWFTLNGYAPYDTFINQWSQLNASSYPFAGTQSIVSYEGQAYSCMMVMAEGFSNIITNVTNNFTLGLQRLVSGDLGSYMVSSAFNVGYVGPDGPMVYDANGDLVNGNYLIYNFNQGNQAVVGHIMSGVLTMTGTPYFYDGSSTPPADRPPSVALNPDWSAPIARVIAAIVSVGVLFAMGVFALVVLYHQHEVFKAASPLFCCLELVGFVLAYVSVTFLVGVPTQATCIAQPLALNLGFLLVLGNLIAKNYRIYRIFNNVFITRTVITDRQLIKSVLTIVGFAMVILVVGLIVTRPMPTMVDLTQSTHYWECSSQHPANLPFMILNTVYDAALLLIATFLAFKTRLAGQQYGHYSECKQMGLSVYNILFSALVGFAITVNPIADFYTKYYITVIATLWATTFSLAILFLPKLNAFIKQKRRQHVEAKEKKQFGEQSQVSQILAFETVQSGGDFYSMLRNASAPGLGRRGHLHDPELLSLEQILSSDMPVCDTPRKKSDASCETRDDSGNLIEVQQGEMPVRRVFRYFPMLYQWEMQHVMIFPWLGYFSHFSQRTNKGHVMSYHMATVHSAELDDYVLKIHGHGWYDVYVQVPDLPTMETWQLCFNHRRTARQSFRRSFALPVEMLRSFQQQQALHFSPSQDPLVEHRRESETKDDEDTVTDNSSGHGRRPSTPQFPLPLQPNPPASLRQHTSSS